MEEPGNCLTHEMRRHRRKAAAQVESFGRPWSLCSASCCWGEYFLNRMTKCSCEVVELRGGGAPRDGKGVTQQQEQHHFVWSSGLEDRETT